MGDSTTVAVYAASISIALYVGSKLFFPESKRVARHGDSLPLLGDTLSAIKHEDRYYDWEAAWTEQMHGRTWLFELVGRPGEFIISNPKVVEDILSTQASSFGKGEYMHEVLQGLLGDGIFAVDGHKWIRQRKTASNLFSMRGLREFMAVVVQGHLETLHDIFDCSVKANKSLDLVKLLNRFTFEVIAEIAFGIKFGGLEADSEHPVEAAFNFAQQRLFERFLEPRCVWKTKAWVNIAEEREFNKCIQVIDDTCYGIISRSLKQRQAMQTGDVKKRDIISLFLDGVSDDDRKAGDDRKTGEEIDPKDLRDIVVAFMFAGRDTTATALSWFFYALSLHPETEEKIHEEIKTKLPELAAGSIASPSMQQANELVYLEASLKETLRLYPAVPTNMRSALQDVVLCDGTEVKAGQAASWSAYSMGRLEHVWGLDAKEFKPERWIDAATGKIVAVSPYKFTLFGAGPRLCLGVKLAMMEMKIATASILSKYHVAVTPGQDVTYRLGLTFAMKNGLQVEINHY